MARGIGGIGHTLLSLSVLAVLTGCGGGPGVTQNALPSGSSGSSGTGGSGGNANPGPSNPGTTNPGTTNPGTTTPPQVSEAIGDPAIATANSAVLTSTQTTVYNLNSVALGSSGWRPTARLETNNSADASSPRVAFDAAGNGFAVWALGNDIFMSRYTASTASWSSPIALDNGIDEAHQARVAVDRQTGNAVASWTQSDGVAESMYAARYNASTNSWTAPQLLENTNGAVNPGPESNSVAISGAHMAVAWRQFDGTATSIYLSRFVSGSWTAPQLLDGTTQEGLHPEVAIDPNGNATVVWRQRDLAQGQFRIHSRRWDATTATLGPIQQLNNNGDRQPRLQFDAQGNGFLLWRGGGVFARRFDVATGTWGTEVQIHNDSNNDAWDGELSVDAAGNAMAVWVENDGTANSVYARRYNAATATWGTSQLLESFTSPASLDHNPTVSVNGNEALVAWVQDNDHPDVYGIKMSEGTWGPVTLLETREESAGELASTINAAGNAAVVWVQADGAAPSIYQARYLTSNYVVPAGATWQTIANALYGVNAAEAGTALQTAMGGGALTEGAILSGFPATLSVTTSIPPYYTVLATDTWSHIAARVYGVTDVAAITRLQTLLGNPTLSTGLHLVVPTTVSYTESANHRAPLDWSRVNTTSTTYHPLDADLLTVPLDNWSTADRLELDNARASSPRVAFDVNGNGISVWAQASDVIVRRYTASNGQWSAPVVLDTNTNTAYQPRLGMDSTTGNAIVSWAQSDGAAVSMYVSSYTASSNTWTTAQLLETSNLAVSTSEENSFAAKRGDHAAVTWLQSNGTVNDVYISRLVAGTWTAPVVLDTGTFEGLHPEVAIDSNGNATAVWRQKESSVGEFRIMSRRWNNTTLAYGAVVALDGEGDRQPRIRFDAAGNGIALWRGGGVFARHYDVATDTWGDQVQIHNGPNAAWNGEVDVDSNGDALTTWVENDGTANSAYARFYNAATATWGAAVLLEHMSTPSDIDNNPTVSLVNGSGVVAWIQNNTRSDLYAARFGGGVWGPAVLLETRDESPAQLTSHVDAHNNAAVLWIQADGAAPSVYQARSAATPYFAVPAGATWQSLANTLYGVNSGAAATALSTAMGNPTLTTGLHLTSLPATLAVSPTVPTHYLVQSGDTWQSITLALYGTSRSEASTALWDYLGRPMLTVNQQLLIPAELSYTISN
jgi:LysM repeat protein